MEERSQFPAPACFLQAHQLSQRPNHTFQTARTTNTDYFIIHFVFSFIQIVPGCQETAGEAASYRRKYIFSRLFS